MIKKLFLFIIILSFTIPLYSQQSLDYQIFVNNSDELSNLYRGTAPIIYPFHHTGTYYAYTENFLLSTIKYNGKIYDNVYLNLNSNLDELYILSQKTKMIAVLNKNFIDYFSIEKRNFVNILKSDAVMQAGFYEVLYSGTSVLYKKIKKTYSEYINQQANTKSQVERSFLLSESYYLHHKGKTKQIRKKSDILSCYNDKKSEVRKFIREEKLDLRRNKEESFIEIVRFVESGINRK